MGARHRTAPTRGHPPLMPPPAHDHTPGRRYRPDVAGPAHSAALERAQLGTITISGLPAALPKRGTIAKRAISQALRDGRGPTRTGDPLGVNEVLWPAELRAPTLRGFGGLQASALRLDRSAFPELALARQPLARPLMLARPSILRAPPGPSGGPLQATPHSPTRPRPLASLRRRAARRWDKPAPQAPLRGRSLKVAFP